MSPVDVFLSHNSRDKDAVRKLRDVLQEHGLTTWLDEDDLLVGHAWLDEIESALQNARSVIVAVGGSGLGQWERPEMRGALITSVRSGMLIIPVLLPGAPEQTDLPLFLQTLTWVDCRDGISPVTAVRIKKALDTRIQPQGKGAGSRHSGKSAVTHKSAGPTQFLHYLTHINSTLGWSIKASFLLPIAPLLLGLGPPWDGHHELQEKGSVALLTIVVQVIGVTGAFALMQNRPIATTRKIFKSSLVVCVAAFFAYVICYLLLTEYQAGTSTRLIAGRFSEAYYEVLAVNNFDDEQTKMDFGWKPLRIYQPWSVWTSLIAVASCWLVFFGTFVFYLGSFAQTAKTEELLHQSDQSIAVLNLSRRLRNTLYKSDIETVGDLCSLSARQLKRVVGGSEQGYEEALEALAEFGIVTKP